MEYHIAELPGDGVGPEVVTEAKKVLEAIGRKYNHTFHFTFGLIGAAAIEATGEPFPKDTQKICESSNAILFGAIGDPKYDNNPALVVRPEDGLLAMRKALGLYANIRPIQTFPSLISHSPLKPELLTNVDFVVVRELTGGIYFGKPRGRDETGTKAFDTCVYTRSEIERIAAQAFEMVKTRMLQTKKQGKEPKLTVVDKANVLATSQLWREVVQSMAARYPEIPVEFLFVDNAAMQIIKRPSTFDVILTENMFGDILTDEASVIPGSIGMLPSASIGEKTALYEPIHGSYPKAAGKQVANPIGTILSAALLLEYSLDLHEEAQAVRRAVENTLNKRIGTPDIMPDKPATTTEVGDAVVREIV